MQSSENTPMSPAKRVGVSLNIDTSYKGTKKDSSPPHTPPKTENHRPHRGNTATANRALKLRTGQRETFLDDMTPIEPSNNEAHDPERSQGGRRDSHDLSLSPRQVTRDSLVDNMLLSLDQFSFGQGGDGFGRHPTVDEEQLYSTFTEETYQPAQNFAPKNGRGVGHNYSYSSDYEAPDDSSRHSGEKLGRGRRSNSSSNFQTNLERINSIRNDATSTFSATRPAAPPQIIPRGTLSRNRKGSKGSSANSFDLGYAQVTSNQRRTHGLGKRSSSFDFSGDRVAMYASSQPISRSTETNKPPFNQYDYDAAPEPTVPVGPRRVRPTTPITIPQPEPVQASPPRKLERKRSTRSSKSGYKGKLSANNGSKDRNRELPPMPAFIKEPAFAPAPLVSYGKPKEQQNPSLAQPKERPGFFRRVFGARSSPVSTTDLPPSHSSTTSTETTDQPQSRPQHIGNQMKSQQSHSSRETPLSQKEPAHVLTKKPSSFFRRRRKSVSEPEPAVPMVPAIPLESLEPLEPLEPLQISKEHLPTRAPHSPVSSLREVMNQYLATPARNPIDLMSSPEADRPMSESPEPNERTVRGFSPDYEPDKSATIRTVQSTEREVLGDLSASLPPTAVAACSTERSLNPDDSRDVSEGTFLQDSSDNDPEVSETSGMTNIKDGSKKPTGKKPSSSVARDRVLGTQCESVHSKRSPTTSSKIGRSKTVSVEESPRSIDESRSDTKQTVLTTKDEEWVMLTPNKVPADPESKDTRVWLEPSSEEEDTEDSSIVPPLKSAQPASSVISDSTETIYKSATSLPILQVEGKDETLRSPSQQQHPPTASEAAKSPDTETPADEDIIPSEEERETASKIYDGDEKFISKEKAAAWMGEDNPVRLRTLVAYMELYNFSNLNVLAALRLMCGRLVLKAESQQVDRILVNFAKRWCKCNPNHGFKGIDVVHTICYSILLLNTDLHLADIDQKMTRSQFVKNTMPTVRKSVADLPSDAFEPTRGTILPGKGSAFETIKQNGDVSLKPERSSIENDRPSWRTSFKPPPRTDSGGVTPTPLDYDTPMDDCGPLVKAPFHGTLRTWEVQVEIVLKDFYNSIRSERLPLFGAPNERPLLQAPSSNSLSVFTNGMLRRSPSVLSKTPSESQSFVRGRTAETVRVGNGKWASKNRSRPRLYPGSGMGSSRTSLDDQSSMWSPSVASSTWSKYSLGKTQTSMSVDSFGSGFLQGDYHQSIGFANALSQAIIREETVGSAGSIGSERDENEDPRVAPLLEDESLELYGAPWAKEGIVKHKHHLESLDKKAKDRNWSEVFAVIEKGYMSLFSFSSKSIRNKNKGKAAGGVVGGGNWQDNATSLGSFLLRQTIASALPSPGYSKARPHVWALSLPSGAVHLFQVGTPDIVKEFVSTANYWSARLSNHPLVGGISNIEYGWSESIVNNSLVNAINESTRPSTSGNRPSLQSSLRSSLDQSYPSGSVRSRLPGDKISISDWTPPTQSMRASNLMEADQLRTLSDYVSGIEDELQKHNQLRNPMLLAFTPRHPNAQKAMANWEKKSSYLLREIVKFRTYIDSLGAAEIGKQKIYAERVDRLAPDVDDEEDDVDITLRPE
ncbi:hypothetical protein WAI453_006823 [Rhynchosporium graminicola]